MVSGPGLLWLTTGSRVAEQCPSVVNAPHARFVFSVSQTDCDERWGSSSSSSEQARCCPVPRSVCTKQTQQDHQAHTCKSVINAFQPHRLHWISSLDLPSPAQNCNHFFKHSLWSTWNAGNCSVSKTWCVISVFSPICCEEMLRKSSFAIVTPNGLPSIFTPLYYSFSLWIKGAVIMNALQVQQWWCSWTSSPQSLYSWYGEAQCAIKFPSFNGCLAPCSSTVFAALLLKGQHGFLRRLCKYFSLSGSFMHLVSLAGQWICVGWTTDSPVWLVTKSVFMLKMFLIFHWCLSSVCPCVSSPLGSIPLLLHRESSGGNLFPPQLQVFFWAHLRSAEQQLPVAFSAGPSV